MIEVELLHYGYLVVLLGTVLEGDATLLTASFLARRGYLSFLSVICLAGFATIAANQMYFEFARRSGPAILNAYPAAARRVGRIYGWLPRYGGPLVIASRFLLGFRTLVPMVCGASGMNRWRFLAWNVSGAALWLASIGSAGYLGAHALTVFIDGIERHDVAVAAGIAIAAVSVTAWFTRGQDWSDFWNLRRSIVRSQQRFR